MNQRPQRPRKDAGHFPLQYLVDFLHFLADNQDRIEVITYSDLSWEDDWNFEDHYLAEFKRWQRRVRRKELDPQKSYVLIQHDVDRLPERTHALLQAEERLGIPSNIMMFCRQPDRTLLRKTGLLEFKDYKLDFEILKRLENKGFVIGYHSNAYEQALFDRQEAERIFERDVQELREHFRIEFFCPHGGVRDAAGQSNASLCLPASLRTSLRWVLNRYSARFHGFYSDGGLRATRDDPRALDLRDFAQSWRPGKRYRVLLHPQHYHSEFVRRPNLAHIPWYDDLISGYESNEGYSAWQGIGSH